MTPQRQAILKVLEESGAHLTPLEVYERVCQVLPGVTETTIYRTLTFLTGQGLLFAAHIGGGQLVYEIAGREHHHLICRACGHACEIDHAMLAGLYRSFEASTGFQIDTTHVTFFGLCPECRPL